ncbi:MAG TPA: hypothetical protein VKB88_19930 [Bryobacteraceae bacterium]|nr:hypothetical protein [Bryobacteraceae bacterium]
MNILGAVRGTRAVLLMAVVAAGSGASPGIPQPLSPERVYVRLADFANLSGRVRAEAEASVQWVFRRAGVEVEFVECRTAPAGTCGKPAGLRDIWLEILQEPPKNMPRDPAGFAVLAPSQRLSDSYAAVSFAIVASRAREMNAPEVHVLAAAIAHELGHLLLCTSSHGRTGIMRQRLDREQIERMGQGTLLFTDREAAAMKARLRSVQP